jgi:kynurenine formamidase
MRALLTLPLLTLILTGCATPRTTPPLDPAKVIDLSYAFCKDTIYWPTAEPFKLQRVAYGVTSAGFWYAANNISMAEHGGTHMDAPIHFAENKLTSSEVPLSSCIGPAAVIDVRAACEKDPDYLLSVGDIQAWEKVHGRLPAGAVVVMHSGWGQRWPDKKTYLGTDKPLDVAGLRFPGFSPEAAAFLVSHRTVAALAIDTASIDRGQSKDFRAHQILNAANKPSFEN